MINKDYLVKQLRGLENRVVADKNWKREQRKLLLSQLRGQTEDIVGLETEKELHIFSAFQMILKPVILLLVFVLGSGWLGVVASEQSLPGDLLYPVKITSEKVKVKLTFDKSKKTELHMELAEKRIGEIKELKKKEVVEQKPVEKLVIKETYDKVKAEVSEAKISLQELKDENKNTDTSANDKTADLVKTVEKVDNSVKNITKDLGDLLVEQNAKALNAESAANDEEGILLADTLTGVNSLGDDVKTIVKEVVVTKPIEIKGSTEATDAVTKIIERSASELQSKSDKIIGDSQKITTESTANLSGVAIKDVPKTLVKTDSTVASETVISPDANLDKVVLEKIKALISDENMVFSLTEGKELADILNQEIITLLNNGEFDKALERLEAGKVIVEKMEIMVAETKALDTVIDPVAEAGRDGLSQEKIIQDLEAVISGVEALKESETIPTTEESIVPVSETN